MYFLLTAVVLILMKYFEWGFAAQWPWWWVLSPLGLAVVWWAWADASGYTKRQAMKKMEERKQERLKRQQEALRMNHKRRP